MNNRKKVPIQKGKCKRLVTDKRYEELKERMKKLLLEKKPSSLINEENKNKEQ